MLIPSLLSLPIYAFELSDRSYKYLKLKSSDDGIMVEDFGEGEIPVGVIEQGEIKQSNILKIILSELFAKKNIRYVAISLPEEKGFLRNIRLDGVREWEVEDAIKFQLEEQVPLPPSEVIFNSKVVRKENDHLDVVLIAFSSELVNSYLKIFSEAGAMPVWVDSELSATIASVVPRTFSGASMIIDWGKTRISFAIADNGVLRFTSTVPIGGDALDEAIAKELGIDIKSAEKLKIENGFNDKSENTRVFQALVPVVTAIREEAEKYITFWQTHSEEKKAPAKLFLSGGGGSLKNIKNYLQKEIGINVVEADPWVNIAFPSKYVPEIEKNESKKFASTIGLSLCTLKNGIEL